MGAQAFISAVLLPHYSGISQITSANGSAFLVLNSVKASYGKILGYNFESEDSLLEQELTRSMCSLADYNPRGCEKLKKKKTHKNKPVRVKIMIILKFDAFLLCLYHFL